MFRTRPGTVLVRNLGAMLRSVFDAAKSAREKEIETRNASGAPLVDENTSEPIEPLGEYDGPDELDSVQVIVDIIPKIQWQIDCRSYLKALKAGNVDRSEFMRGFVQRNVRWVGGFKDAGGAYDFGDESGLQPLSDEHVNDLDAMGLITYLFQAAENLQVLSGKPLASYGSPQPLT